MATSDPDDKKKTDDRRPLTPAQRATARELGWYRRWLLSTGRTAADIDKGSRRR